jgi:hypothetical protein
MEVPEAHLSSLRLFEHYHVQSIIKHYGIDKIIERSNYPGTSMIGKLNSILCFLALKLSNVERYGHDDGWCMDRGLGMFAGLRLEPDASDRVYYAGVFADSDVIRDEPPQSQEIGLRRLIYVTRH